MNESHYIAQSNDWNRFISDGDETVLSKIYAENYDLLYDYDKRTTSIDKYIEDANQDTFISIIKYRERISPTKNLRGYLVSSFRRQLIIEVDRQKKLIPVDQLHENFFEYYGSTQIEDEDRENSAAIHAAVYSCVNKLTQKQREILYLRFNSGISYEEIAEGI